MKNIDTKSIKFWNYIYPFMGSGDNIVDQLDIHLANVTENMYGTNSLYIHIPFCETICAFCPFLKSIYNSDIVDKYLDCLEKEVKMLNEKPLIEKMIFDTITVGGGSPTALSEHQLARLLKILGDNFKISTDYEWSVECESKSLTEEKAKIMKAHGVNRVSIGMQTLNQYYRKMLNLTATIEDVENAINIAKKYFPLQNLDLLYALPGQTSEEILEDLDKATKLGSTSIDTYPLEYVSCSSAFLKRIDKGMLPPRPTLDQVIELTQSIFNYFKSNNWNQVLTYTFFSPNAEKQEFRYGAALYGKINDYVVGIGASSFSHYEGLCYSNISDTKKYMEMLDDNKLPIVTAREYYAYERELVSFPKRIDIEKKYVEKIATIFPKVTDIFKEWNEAGYLEDHDTILRLKPEYRAYFIPMMYQLLPDYEKTYMTKVMEKVENEKLGRV